MARETRLSGERQLALAASIAETAVEGFMVCDAANRIVWINRAFTEITGHTAADAIGATPRILHSGMHDAPFYRAMWAGVLASGSWQGEIWNRRKDGTIFPAWLHLQTMPSTGHHYVGKLSDLSDDREQARNLRRLAYFDALTGLPNRNLFHDRLQQACHRAAREKSLVAVMFIDLDRFKQVNDAHGHDSGDHLLKMVAARLTACMRGGDTLSRFGGDEFVAILPDVGSMPEIAHVAERMRHALSLSLRIRDAVVCISASIGISVFPDDAHDAASLVKSADVAMYYAKERGGNDFDFFDRRFGSALRSC